VNDMRWLYFAVAALVAFATDVPAVRADAPVQDTKAAALLAKHRAFVGWQFGDGTFKTMRITGTMVNEKGEKAERFVAVYAGLIYQTTSTWLQKDNITEHDGFTGKLFWYSSMNGFTTPVYEDLAKYLASFTVLLQEGASELPARFVKEASVDGKTAEVVRVTLYDGDPIDCYVDPDTGAFLQAVIDPDGAYESMVHILGYQEIAPRKKMIASYRFGDDKDVLRNDTVEPNVVVTPDDFHPPTPTATWTFGDGNAVPITLKGARILVDATVNGVKGRFILDTGSDGIVLDDQFADRAKVTALRVNGEAETMSGTIPTRVRSADTIGIGGATLHNTLVFSQDFRRSDYRGLDWAGYDGLIGYDLFAGAIVKLDIYGSKLTIADPASDTSSQTGVPLLVDLSDGIPAIPMTYAKRIAVNAILDTGSPGTALIRRDVLRNHHISTSHCGSVESLTIGPITYMSPTQCTWGLPFGTKDVLLGLDFLRHFDYVFDYPHGRMFMTPNKN
jgi:hypothetical protein